MESKTGLKAPEKLCTNGSLMHKKNSIRILFADICHSYSIYFPVVLYVREMPPYELLLKVVVAVVVVVLTLTRIIKSVVTG